MDFRPKSNLDEEEVESHMADINIVPFVDILLVLLVVFMVAAPLSMSGIKIKMPSSRAKSAVIDENRVVLTIDKKGSYYVGKVNITSAKLETKLKAIFEYRKNKDLYIRADKRVVYGKVVSAMGYAKMAGVDKISMLTKPSK